MRGENSTQRGGWVELLVGSYAAEPVAEPLGTAVLGGALIVPPITGGLALRERRSAVSAQ